MGSPTNLKAVVSPTRTASFVVDIVGEAEELDGAIPEQPVISDTSSSPRQQATI
jgi:hypothetical protein